MLKQRFRLYRDLLDKEPRFKRMAPLSLLVHATPILIAHGILYWNNGTIWTLGGGGGGGGPEMTVVMAVGGAQAPPDPPKPEPKKPELKPDPPKPKPEPKKPEPTPEPEEIKEEPKPSVDPDAVKTPTKEEPKKKEPDKKKEEEKKEEKQEEPKPEPKKPEPKPTPKKPNPTPTPKKPAITDAVQGPGTAKPSGGGAANKAGSGPGPAGPSNLPPGLAGWGRTLQMKVERLWVMPAGVAMSPENYADIEFTVDRAGNILGEPRIVKEALDPAVALSGLHAIKTAKRMPPFPDSYTGPQITVMYRFSVSQ